MLSLRWPRLCKLVERPGTTPIWLHGRVLRLREETGEYEGDHQYAGHLDWHFAEVLARVLSLSRLTPQGPDEPLPAPRDVTVNFDPFPNGLRSGVEFRVAGRLFKDGRIEPVTESLELVAKGNSP